MCYVFKSGDHHPLKLLISDSYKYKIQDKDTLLMRFDKGKLKFKEWV